MLIFFASATALGVCAVGGALWHFGRPEVQRALAMDALIAAGLSGEVESVAVGLGGAVEVRGVRLTNPDGTKVSLDQLSGDFSPWGSLWGDHHIGKLVLEGLVIDLSGRKAAAVEVAGAPGGDGVRVFTPPHVRVDALDATGRVILPGRRELPFELRARDADTKAGGTIVFKVADGVTGPVVTGEARVKYAGEIRLGGDPLAAWGALKPDVTLDAEARPAPDATGSATLALVADASSASLKLKAGGSTADVDLTGIGGVPTLKGKFSLARSAPAGWGGDFSGVPDFHAGGVLNLSFTPATRLVEATAEFSGDTVVAKIGPEGPRDFSVKASVSGTPGGAWSIRHLNAKAGTSQIPEAVRLDVTGVRLTPGSPWRVETPEGEGASLRLTGAPLAWLNPLLSSQRVAFLSGTASGEWRLTRDAASRLVLAPVGEPSTSTFALAREGRPWLDDLRLFLPARFERAASGAVSARGEGVRLTRAGGEAASVNFEYTADERGAGRFKADSVLAPGVLPGDFLPGGACGFCRDAGLTFALKAYGSTATGAPPTLEAASVDAVTREGARALGVKLLRPVTGGDLPADGAPIASFVFKGFPLGVFNPLMKGPSLGGVAESGELHFAKGPAGWKVVRPKDGAPAFVRGLAWSDASGAVVLAPTDARGSLAWAQTDTGWSLDLRDIRFSNKTGEALNGRVGFVWAGRPKAVEAELSGELPALIDALPSAGRLRTETGRFSLKTHQESEYVWVGEARLDDLRGEVGASPLSAGLRGRVTRSGERYDFAFPAELFGPSGRTSLSLDGSMDEAQGVRRWDVALKGGVLHADDWKPLFAPPAVVAKPVESVPSPVAPGKHDTAPFWTGNVGAATLALDAVSVSGETVSKPRIGIVVTPENVKIRELSAEARGLSVRGGGALDFRAGLPKPYRLDASGGVETLPLGKVVATVAPKAAGWLDGDFNLRFSARGEGATLAGLSAGTVCSVTGESTGGTLRFFKADNEAVRLSGEIAGIAGDLAGDLGRILGKRNPGAGRILSGGSVIQKALDVVKYQKLAFTVNRLPDGTLEVPSAEIFNEVLRLRVNGSLGPAYGAAFLDRNATVAARLDGRDLIAEALRGLGRASTAPDTAGWLAGPELRYEGPLNNVRNNLLNNLFRAVSIPGVGVPGIEGARGVTEGIGNVLEGILK